MLRRAFFVKLHSFFHRAESVLARLVCLATGLGGATHITVIDCAAFFWHFEVLAIFYID